MIFRLELELSLGISLLLAFNVPSFKVDNPKFKHFLGKLRVMH